MVRDTSTRRGDDVTPEFSGIYLDRFADDTIGIAITATNQTRNNGVNGASTVAGSPELAMDSAASPQPAPSSSAM